ncbi:MAG TPA: DUF1624 domain-containing protein [Candidatus Tenderia sp.]|nr:DUF1624 domain-containing protein [Candidatus Tenderia sp.]
MADHVAPTSSKAPRPRYLAIDVLRGIAIALMVVFHFTYDLDHFHFVDVDFHRDPFWLNFRLLIVVLFLGLVGFSLQLATGTRLNFPRYLRRLAMLVGAAALVSLGTYVVFGDKMILFGVLHFIALASLLGLLFRHFYWLNLLLGIGIIAAGMNFQHEWFNAPQWHWIGLMTKRPITLDYVPMIPWFGIVLIGMFSARVVQKYKLLTASAQGGENPLTKVLALGGQHGLLIYLLHQPLLFGALSLVAFL